MRPSLVATVALVGAISSFASCKRDQRPTDGPDLIMPVHPTPVLPSAKFIPVQDVSAIALPRGCTLLPPVVRARVDGDKVRFAVASGAPDDLAVAWLSRSEGGTPLFVHGIIRFDDPQGARDITWYEGGRAPFFAAVGGRWLALLDAAGEGNLKQVLLARDNASDERLAVGDQLRAVDLSCAGKRCAALTTRAGNVTGPGASLFTGTSDVAASSWVRTDLAFDQQGAQPVAIGAVDASSGDVDVVLTIGQKAALFRTSRGSVRADSTLETRFGVMDAITVGGKLTVASVGDAVDEQGCFLLGSGKVIVEMSGSPAFALNTPASPRGALMRPLSQGAILAWLSPVTCRHPDRWIVYAVVLDGSGKPTGSPMAVSDASGFSLWTSGDDISVVLDTPDGITRINAKCKL